MELYMAIKTLDLREIDKVTDNVYEACLVISRRARSINADRIAKRKEKEILEESGFEQDFDPYDREFYDPRDYEKEINPTVIAQDELFDNKITTRYITEKEESE
jgi:DNA-directed RNA polymerase subunit K/omega